MPYTTTLYDSIDDVPARDWEMLRENASLASDQRLLSAFEKTMSGQCRCWTAVVRDERGEAAGAASLCLFCVDPMETTGAAVQGIVRRARRLFPNTMKFRVLFCGLPVPSGTHHLHMRPGADAAATMLALDDAMRALAKDQCALMLVFKEFDARHATAIDALRERGYGVGDVPQAWVLRKRFGSFDDLCAALRSNYRWKVSHSVKKFEQANFRVEHLSGGEIAAAYTDELHRLYEAVWSRAKYRLEKLSPEFFRETSRRFGEQASMTVVRRTDGRVAGFVFGITDDAGEYHNLYGGIEDDPDDVGLYFNLQYRDLDAALRRGATAVHFGQTAEEFKARLGAIPEPLVFYARAVNPVLNLGLRRARSLVFPPVEKTRARDVFKTPEAPKPAKKKGVGSVKAQSAGNTSGRGRT